LLQAPAQTEWFQGKEVTEVVKDELKFGANKATIGVIASAELASKNLWAGHVAATAPTGWLESSVKINENKNVLTKAHTEGRLSIASLNFEIRCPSLDAEGLKLIAGSKEATGGLKFLGCKGFQISTGTEQEKCTPETTSGVKEQIIADGKALDVKLATEKGKAASLKELILFGPAAGKTWFATVKLSELCALAETSNITGSLVAECGRLEPANTFVGEECSVAQKVHLLQAATPTTFWKGPAHMEEVKDELKFGLNKAMLNGIQTVELESGNPWAGDA
jgi:hypothetical protein